MSISPVLGRPTGIATRPAWGRVAGPALVGLAAGVVVEGSATYSGLWFPARWAFRFPGLGSPDLARWQASALYFGGLVVLGLAWVWLLRNVRADARLPAWSVLVVFVVWSVPFLVGPPASSDDVYAYVGLGHQVERGIDPYEVGVNALGADPVVDVTSPFWRDSPSPYGPVYVRVAWLAGVVTPDSFRATVTVLRLFGLACLLLLAVPLAALARRAGTRPAFAFAAVLCSPLVIVQLVGAAHNDALMLLLLAAGVAVGLAGLSQERGDRRLGLVAAGVALCGAAAAVKLPALIGAVLLGWLWAAAPLRGPVGHSGDTPSVLRRLPGVAASVALATAVVIGLSLASGLGLGWLSALDVPQKAQTLLAPFTAVGVLVQQLLDRAGWPSGGVLSFVRPAGTVVGIVAAGWFITRADRGPSGGLGPSGPRSGGLGVPLALGCALMVLAATTPAVWPWYAVWGLVFIGTVTMPPGLEVAVVALNLAVTPLGPGTLDVSNRPNASALFMVLVLLGGAAWAFRSRPRAVTTG